MGPGLQNSTPLVVLCFNSLSFCEIKFSLELNSGTPAIPIDTLVSLGFKNINFPKNYVVDGLFRTYVVYIKCLITYSYEDFNSTFD